MLFMKENGLVDSEMVWGNRGGQMAHFMKVSGSWERLMVMESFIMLMGTFTKEIGSMIKQTGKEPILTRTEPSMLDNGRMINSTDSDSRPGQMGQFMRVGTPRERNMGRVG
jgi:hypothetical protein